jgi:transposase
MSKHGKPRITEPERQQATIRFEAPDDALDGEHPARVLWQALGKLNLSAFLDDARSVEGGAGRPTHSPRLMLTLWTYAISQGVGSAREIERLTRSDRAYEWIIGGVEVSHSSLSRFRVGHRAALDKLMTDILAALMHKGVLSLRLVAQDGMRVRAAASAPSFRTLDSLLDCREQAELHLKAVLAQADDPELSLGQKAAREVHARDFQRRIEEAISAVESLQEQRGASRPPARASTTDAEARVMKMGDGGFRPALNVQMATAGSEFGGPRTIIGVEVCNIGSDMGALTPMLDQIERRMGQLPETLLADANHGNHTAIADGAARGVNMLVAVSKRSRESSAKGDKIPEIVAWKMRMQSDDAKRLYRARAGLCECTNAHVAGRFGLRQFLVRGIAKATSVALLVAITSNLTQYNAPEVSTHEIEPRRAAEGAEERSAGLTSAALCGPPR